MNGQYPYPVYVGARERGGGGKGAALLAVVLGLGALGAGGFLLYSRVGLVRAKISSFTVSPTSVAVGDTIEASISWQNVGVKPYDFDVVAFFGNIDTMEGWGGLMPDASTIPLQKETTHFSITVPDVPAQAYDGHAIICDATDLGDGTYRLDKVYAIVTKKGLVTVGGPPPPPPPPAVVEILALALTKS
jgi:hypothetical protein